MYKKELNALHLTNISEILSHRLLYKYFISLVYPVHQILKWIKKQIVHVSIIVDLMDIKNFDARDE